MKRSLEFQHVKAEGTMQTFQSTPGVIESRQMKPREDKTLTLQDEAIITGKSRVPEKLFFRTFLSKCQFLPFLMSEFSRCYLVSRKRDRKNISSLQESKYGRGDRAEPGLHP